MFRVNIFILKFMKEYMKILLNKSMDLEAEVYLVLIPELIIELNL